MPRLEDIDIIMKICHSWITVRPHDKVLHIACGGGTLTYQYLSSTFSENETIVAVEACDDVIGTDRVVHYRPYVHYQVLDILNESEVTLLKSEFGKFHRIVCFCFGKWVNVAAEVLQNIKILMKKKAQCFLAFVGSSPVFDAFETLAEDDRFAEYMQGYENYVPLTSRNENPARAFKKILINQNFEVLRKRNKRRIMYSTTLNIFNNHIKDVSPFFTKMPEEMQRNFITVCYDRIFGGDEMAGVFYKIVTILVKRNLKSETIFLEQDDSDEQCKDDESEGTDDEELNDDSTTQDRLDKRLVSSVAANKRSQPYCPTPRRET